MTSAVDERRGDGTEHDSSAYDEAELDERYGGSRTARSRRTTLIGGVLIALFTLGVIGYWGLSEWQGGGESAINASVVGFGMAEPGVAEAHLSLTAPTGTEIACAIEVQNAQHLIVGWDVVVFPASAEITRNITVQVRTTQELDGVLVNRCWIP